MHHDLVSPPVRLRLRGPVQEPALKRALRATLDSAHLLGLALGVHLRHLRAERDPLISVLARFREAELRARLAWETVDILAARMDKIPERRRPFYTPSQRFRILEIKSLLDSNQGRAAQVFRICSNTIANWEAHADPAARTVGSTVKPVPPIRQLADVVRSTIEALGRLGFGGDDLTALTLARAGWRLSARSVSRIRRERPRRPVPPPATPKKPPRPVVARFVNHVWMMDVTIIRTFLGREIHLAGAFDAFSRVPLALQAFDRKPGASAMARLVQDGRPRLRSAEVPHHRSRTRVHRDGLSQGRGAPRHRPAFRLSRQPPCHRPVGTILANPQRHREPSSSGPTHTPGPGTKARNRPRPLLLPPPASGTRRRHADGGLPRLTARPPACGLAAARQAGGRPRSAPFTIDFLDPNHRSFPILKAA